MSVSDTYLAATVNAAAVAKHHGVKAFINMSQMTVAQMSITETTPSPQHKLHWLAEQALNWSGLPVVHVRPTVFLEGLFMIMTADSVGNSNQIRLPFGDGKTSPVAAEDVARAVAALLVNPRPHIGRPITQLVRSPRTCISMHGNIRRLLVARLPMRTFRSRGGAPGCSRAASRLTW